MAEKWPFSTRGRPTPLGYGLLQEHAWHNTHTTHWQTRNMLTSVLLQCWMNAVTNICVMPMKHIGLPTKFLQPVNLAILTIWSLFNGQPPHSTRSSSVVTLSCQPTISSLKITDHSFRYASPHLWNQLPDSFRQPRQSCLDSPPYSLVSSSLLSSPLS